MSSKVLRCEFSSNTFESSRFESCFQYEKEIAKHFQGKRAISRAIIAWNFKKHHFPKGLSPFFTRKWFRRNKYATYVNQTLSFDPSNFRQRAFSRPICEVLSTRICNTTNKAWLRVGKWADLCGTAMQSQLATEPEQAPDVPSPCKNKFNIEEDTWSSYQILSW